MTDREKFEAHMRGLNACTRMKRQSEAVGGKYQTISVQRAWELWQASRKQMAEEAAAVCARWRDVSYLKLHAGEMSAQEVRTVKAVLFAIDGRIRALATPTEGKT